MTNEHDDGQPIIGNPYHGLIKGGLVRLPNGDTVPHTQPGAAANTLFPYAASAFYVANPLAPGLTRTPEQAAADAVKGLQWNTTAIISGCRYLHGKDIGLGKWVFCAPSGTRWLIDPGLQSISVSRFGNSIATTWTATRFGELEQAPEVQNGSLNLADAGQSTPIIWRTYPSDEQSGGRLRIVDITPDGGAALFGLYDSDNYPNTARDPIGFYQVSVTETGGIVGATITMVKSRDECLGSRSWFDDVINSTVSIYSHETFTDCDPPLGGSCDTTTVTDWAVYPASFDPGSDPDYRLKNGAQVTSGSRGWSNTGKVIGMYYDALGVAQAVTADETWTETYNYVEPTVSSSGSRIVRKTRPADGSPITYELISESRVASATRSGSTTTTTTFTISGPGVSKTLSDTVINSWADDWQITYVNGGESYTETASITLTKTTNGAPSAPIVYPVPGVLYTSIQDLFEQGASVNPMVDPFDPLFSHAYSEYLAPDNSRTYAKMFTNKIGGLYKDDAPNGQRAYGPMGGSEASSATVDTIPDTQPYFITYDPVNALIVRGEDAAVNYV